MVNEEQHNHPREGLETNDMEIDAYKTLPDPDQTDEYNNSLIFGNDSKFAETQNHGNILDNDVLPGSNRMIDDVQETQVDSNGYDKTADSYRRRVSHGNGHNSNPFDQRATLNGILDDSTRHESMRHGLEDRGVYENSHRVEYRQTNSMADTQVVYNGNGQADTQLIGSIQREGSNGDTQLIRGSASGSQPFVNGDTQIISPQAQFKQPTQPNSNSQNYPSYTPPDNDATQLIPHNDNDQKQPPSHSSPNKINESSPGGANDSLIIEERTAVDDEDIGDYPKTSSSPSHNDTLGIVLAPSQNSVNGTLSGNGTNSTGITDEEAKAENGSIKLPLSKFNNTRSSQVINIASPHTQMEYTKSLVEIPGTVERQGVTTQVPNTQELSAGDISMEFETKSQRDDEESIHTDDEHFVPMYDDSVLNHKLKIRDRSKDELDPESPTKGPSGAEKTLPNDSSELLILRSTKRHKRNIIDSQSEGSQPATPRSSNQHSDKNPNTSTLKPQTIESDMTGMAGTNDNNLTDSNPLSQSSRQVLRQESTSVLTQSSVVSMASVFANHKFRMYTGTVNNVGKEQLEILFEEGAYDIDNGDLYPLDLRIGDAVKIKGSPIPYVVTGLSCENSQSGIRCLRGFNRVFLKRQRRSRKANSEEIDVSISQLFMELNDWYQHQQSFKLDLEQSIFNDTLTSIIAENIKTPTRNRHTQDLIRTDPVIKSPRSRISNSKKSSEGIFCNSLFCITSVNDDTKNELIKLIYAHGGSIIEDGFMELFTYRKGQRLELSFKHKESSEFKFVALISNDISRSSKYLQTLALGWPVLSERFIYDITQHATKFDHWPGYMLGAGKSSKLGSITSLDVFKFQLSHSRGFDIKAQINNNTDLLEGCTIVGLDGINNSKEIITCEFIFYAFGAKNFVIKSNMEELCEYVRQCQSKLGKVYVYDNGGNDDGKSIGKRFKDIKVINWEWVVQCCISNHIWDE